MKSNYVDKQEFMAALIEHKAKVDKAKAENLPKPKISEYIGECLLKIATNLAKRSNFNRYSYKDEMILDALENAILYLDNFDPTNIKQNPFGYFTKNCWYTFLRRKAKEEKQQYIKYKMTENFGVLSDEELAEFSDNANPSQLYENMYEFIDNFEKDIQKKKQQLKDKREFENFIPEDFEI